MQLILQLIMNTGYGVTGLKPINVSVSYVPDSNYTNLIDNNFASIRCFTKQMSTHFNRQRFERYKEMSTHFNRQHHCRSLTDRGAGRRH